MSAKNDALTQIVSLATQHGIGLEEIAQALGRTEVEANKKSGFTLVRVMAYLGGIFLLAGLGSYTALLWGELSSVARIIITLGPGVVCILLAVAHIKQNKDGKNATILIIMSALFQASGLFVAVYEFSTGEGTLPQATLMIFSVMALQYGLLFYRLQRTSLLFFTLYFSTGAFVSLCLLLDVPNNVIELICGTTILALSYGIQRTVHNSLSGFGYFISSLTLLWMGFDVLENSPLELFYLGIACFMLYLSTIVRSRSMLVTSTIAIFSYISYFTAEHFADSIGWPICLMLLGAVFLATSNLALKVSRRIVER